MRRCIEPYKTIYQPTARQREQDRSQRPYPIDACGLQPTAKIAPPLHLRIAFRRSLFPMQSAWRRGWPAPSSSGRARHQLSTLSLLPSCRRPQSWIIRINDIWSEHRMHTSCSTNRIVICAGIGTSRIAICRRRVDLPTPMVCHRYKRLTKGGEV